MNEIFHANTFEIIVLIGNVAVAVLNNGIKAKLKELKQDISISQSSMALSMQQLETRILEKFLTKDDYYAHQKAQGAK